MDLEITLDQVCNMINKEKIIIFVLIVLITIFFIFISFKSNFLKSNYNFKIYFFNAGKADAILISNNSKNILIDTGEEENVNDILNYFINNNITKLDYLIVTHFDKDHVGGASSIIDNIEIGEVIESSYIKESEYYSNYINSLSKKSITPKTITGDYTISLGDLIININGPEEIFSNNESNNSSLIVSITYKNNNFLFMGDSEELRISDFINKNSKTYDFIKIPYHGNYLSNLDSLLNETKVNYSVMTCSNEEGCEDETIDLVNKYSINNYMTKNGGITLLSNGYDIIISQ